MAKTSPGKNNKGHGNSNKEKPPLHVPRTTVDDPQNDIFDDELFDDEGPMPKARPKEEKFEKPW